MMTEPGFNSPFSSASLIMASATRSFTEPAGLNPSSLASTLAFSWYFSSKWVSSISGVLPMSCSADV